MTNQANVIKITDIRKQMEVSEKQGRDSRKLKEGLINPSNESYEKEIVPSHAAEPIKSMDDIFRISKYLIDNRRYRDNMLFIVGINFGLRVSDLSELRFSDIINDDFSFKTTFPVFEKKTRNTRKRKCNRYITVNKAVMEAVSLYLENTSREVYLSDYMFRSESNNGYDTNTPLTPRSIYRILTGIAEVLDLDIKVSTHTLRKTFGYHQMAMSHNDPRKLLLLQKMFGHSTQMQTLTYIGLTSEEFEDAYSSMNLGSVEHNYLVDSSILEDTETESESEKGESSCG